MTLKSMAGYVISVVVLKTFLAISMAEEAWKVRQLCFDVGEWYERLH